MNELILFLILAPIITGMWLIVGLLTVIVWREW